MDGFREGLASITCTFLLSASNQSVDEVFKEPKINSSRAIKNLVHPILAVLKSLNIYAVQSFYSEKEQFKDIIKSPKLP